MAPKKSKGKQSGAQSAAPQQQQRNLNTRALQQPQQQDSTGDDAAADQPPWAALQLLLVPRNMACTGLLDSNWKHVLLHPGLTVVQSWGAYPPLWADSFCVSVDSSWIQPPLHKYLTAAAAGSVQEQLHVQLWRERRWQERLRLSYKLLEEHGDVTAAAILAPDFITDETKDDCVRTAVLL